MVELCYLETGYSFTSKGNASRDISFVLSLKRLVPFFLPSVDFILLMEALKNFIKVAFIESPGN